MVDMKVLEVRGLKTGYRLEGGAENILLEDFNLTAEEGELIALIGANGAGKSTLLRVLAGLQEPRSGAAEWFGKSLPEIPVNQRPRYAASLFRNFAKADGMSVYDLVALGRHPYTGMFGRLRDEDREAVEHAMTLTGISDFRDRQAATLSDGEFQKAMLAKLLAQDAPLMILDEPATHLDLPAAVDLLRLLNRLSADHGKTVIFSTHNIAPVFKLVRKIILLDGRGNYAAGTPEQLSEHHLMCSFLRTDKVRVENGNLIYNFDNK